MARALIVGCGCRGRQLARGLHQAGWLVRGTTRDAAGSSDIEEAGAEAALADPGVVATVLDHVHDATLVFWLMGSASGEPDSVAALHGPRLERLLEELVDTPVRGFVYEAAGAVGEALLREGGAVVAEAAQRWRIPAAVVDEDPGDVEAWAAAMLAAAERLTGSAGA